MIPIRAICPDCLTVFADAIEQLPGDRKALLNAYCKHHKVAVTALVQPGLVISDWGMFPASNAEEAQARAQIAQAQNELIEAALASDSIETTH